MNLHVLSDRPAEGGKEREVDGLGAGSRHSIQVTLARIADNFGQDTVTAKVCVTGAARCVKCMSACKCPLACVTLARNLASDCSVRSTSDC